MSKYLFLYLSSSSCNPFHFSGRGRIDFEIKSIFLTRIEISPVFVFITSPSTPTKSPMSVYFLKNSLTLSGVSPS
jgi:hypothetical protein